MMEKKTRGGSATIGFICMGLGLAISIVHAADPSPLQDFCVAITNSSLGVYVNGLFCKDPREVTVEDFVYSGFNRVGNTSNTLGAVAVQVNVSTFPALNTLGVAMARQDFAPGGVNPPHWHPRASEMQAVVQGTLYVGVVSSDLQTGGNRLYAKVLHPGDIFVFPQGLIHFQLNIGDTPAVTNSAFGSQNPGRVTAADAVFGSVPPILEDVLTKGFQVDDKVIQALRSQFESGGVLHQYYSLV